MDNKPEILDTFIAGAGIAGLTSAIYAARKKMKYKIIGSEFGGQFNVSGEVGNYPGIIKTTGVEFSLKMQEQMKANDILVDTDTVKEVHQKENKFTIVTEKTEYESKTVIIATGARARELGVPGEQEYKYKGVTYCSICDGPLYGGKDVAIVGGGDAALEAVDFMMNIANKIYLIVRKDKLQAYEYLQEKIEKNSKIEVLYNTTVEEIMGEKLVNKIRVKQGESSQELDVDAAIIEIGRIPNTEIFKDLVKLDEHRHIQIDCQTHTSTPGVFAAGDCASGHEFQYVIAAGQGCMALIKAARYLSRLKN